MGLLVHSSHGLPFYSHLMQPRYPYLWLPGFALANPGSSGIWWHSWGSANICFWRTLPVKCGGRIGESQNSCTSRTLSPHGQKYFMLETTHLLYLSVWRTLSKKKKKHSFLQSNRIWLLITDQNFGLLKGNIKTENTAPDSSECVQNISELQSALTESGSLPDQLGSPVT